MCAVIGGSKNVWHCRLETVDVGVGALLTSAANAFCWTVVSFNLPTYLSNSQGPRTGKTRQAAMAHENLLTYTTLKVRGLEKLGKLRWRCFMQTLELPLCTGSSLENLFGAFSQCIWWRIGEISPTWMVRTPAECAFQSCVCVRACVFVRVCVCVCVRVCVQVFPPSFRELPPPKLDLFDLDEHFTSEKARLAQLTNKCELLPTVFTILPLIIISGRIVHEIH